jgi:hypothetical protein
VVEWSSGQAVECSGDWDHYGTMNLLTDQSSEAGMEEKTNLLQTSSVFEVQCKLNLQTDRFNLRRVLIDELTNRSVRDFLEIGENELTNRSVQIQNR